MSPGTGSQQPPAPGPPDPRKSGAGNVPLPRGDGNGGDAGAGAPNETPPAAKVQLPLPLRHLCRPSVRGSQSRHLQEQRKDSGLLDGTPPTVRRRDQGLPLYLYDDSSDDDPMAVLQPLVDRGVVITLNQTTIPAALEGVVSV